MRLLHACPPACERLPVDLTRYSNPPAEPACERLRTLELIDRMVAGGMRRSDALRATGLAKSTHDDWRRADLGGGLKALAPRSTRPRGARPGSGSSGTAAWSRPSTAAGLGPGVRPSTPSSAETRASH